MRTRFIGTLIAAAIVAAAVPGTVFATDGYFMPGYGTGQKGMAGAGIALLFGPSDAARNPAAGVFSAQGIEFGVAAFSPDRQFEVTGTPSGQPGTFGLKPGTVVSDSHWFPVPHFAIGWNLGRAAAFGIAMYGNGGMNTTYTEPVFGGSTPTGVNLSQMFVAPHISFKFAGGSQAVGVSAVVAYQRFDAKGLEAFSMFSSAPAKVTNNAPANSYGAGARVGYLSHLSYFTVGASYQSHIQMSKFENFSGLFAEQGGFDIPSTWVTGFAVRPFQGLDIAVDVQRVNYSEVKSIANPMLPNLQTARLGDTEGAGFGWKDITTVKIGVQMHVAPSLMVRGGFSYGDQPVQQSEMLFNILAPGVIERHVSAGFTKAVGQKGAVHAAVTRALSHSVTGPNPLEVPGRQQITLTMDQWDFEVSYTIRFGG
jgi:long-chain fatty acid transport protein